MTKPNEAFPSNSISKKSNKEVVPITKGNVIKRQQPLISRIFGENFRSVGSYVLWDVLIPAAKTTFLDIVNNGIEMAFWGEPDRRHIRRDKSRSYVSYNSIYSGRDRRPERTASAKARSRFDDVVIDSRSEAEDVLSHLVDLIETYDIATVADFYTVVGLNADWSDHKYGWDNLSKASVARVREGYIIDLPRPVPLN